jgi:predicted AAA+ superfamily ATPase
MERSLLKKSIDEWQEFYLRAKSHLVLRKNTPAMPDKNFGLALIGLRRSGKTYSAIQITSEQPEGSVLYYNFEDPLFFSHPELEHLDTLLSVAHEYSTEPIETLILDELQNISGWERWLRKIIDQKLYRVILTGSSAKLLSSELATSLSGRCLENNVWPLSLSEYISFTEKNPTKESDYLAILREYLTWGSLPEVALSADEHFKRKVLKQYLGDIVLKDVINRHDIRNKRALDQILVYYLTNLSSLHSYSSISKAFQITTDTVSDYSGFLADTFLISEVDRYHSNLKVQARDPRKVYIIDNGFRHVGARSIQDDTGKLLENAVYWELRRREREVTYYKGKQEVDFIVTEKYKPVEALQVCASNLSDPTTYKREVEALKECIKELGINKAKIITHAREEKLDEIEFIPAYKWFLS